MTKLLVTITKRNERKASQETHNFIFASKAKISKDSLNSWDRLQILYESGGWKFKEMKSSNPPRPCGILRKGSRGQSKHLPHQSLLHNLIFCLNKMQIICIQMWASLESQVNSCAKKRERRDVPEELPCPMRLPNAAQRSYLEK